MINDCGSWDLTILGQFFEEAIVSPITLPSGVYYSGYMDDTKQQGIRVAKTTELVHGVDERHM